MSSPIFDLSGKRVFVAGHRGMVGSALVRRLQSENCEIITASRGELDLRNQAAVETFMRQCKPQVVFLAAAKVGGILANATFPADFLVQNLQIETNLIASAHQFGVEKLTFLGSSCIYPGQAPQPMPEDALLTGPLEATNEWYAIAKIAGIKMCEAYRKQHGCDFISAMPTNLYGPHDNFDLTSSHVLPALIAKAHHARIIGAAHLDVWGSGTPLREFLHVDDCADALVFLTKRYSGAQHVNVGSGKEISIGDLARLVLEVVGHKADLRFDLTKPDGTMRKLMDNSKLKSMGWTPRISLRDGLAAVYSAYAASVQGQRGA